jgi:hypothetical protein
MLSREDVAAIRSAMPPTIVRVPHPIIGEIPPGLRKRLKDKFAYGLDFLPLAANTTAPLTFNVEADSDFIIVSAQAIVTSTDNLTLQTFNPLLVDMRDTGSGRTFFNSPRHFNTVFGTAEAPALWWRMGYVKRLRASSTMLVQIQNLDPANAFNVRLTFDGFKVFDVREDSEDT